MKYYITADTHFYHSNIIKYCDRPFKNVEEMNAYLINQWNNIVSNEDTIIHLGDFCLGSKENCKDILSKLNGRKILIKGNHDRWSDKFYREAGFYYVSRYPILWNNFYLLSHAPLQLSETTPYANFYGHVHNDEKYKDTENCKCVCVERTEYKPVLLKEID